jgi:hypothetical protein
VVELEATAIAWTVNACKRYLLGCPHFTIFIDHHPLVGVFLKDMNVIDNPRLIRICEKLLGYKFDVK